MLERLCFGCDVVTELFGNKIITVNAIPVLFRDWHLWKVFQAVTRFSKKTVKKEQTIVVYTFRCWIGDMTEEIVADQVAKTVPKVFRCGKLTKNQHTCK